MPALSKHSLTQTNLDLVLGSLFLRPVIELVWLAVFRSSPVLLDDARAERFILFRAPDDDDAAELLMFVLEEVPFAFLPPIAPPAFPLLVLLSDILLAGLVPVYL